MSAHQPNVAELLELLHAARARTLAFAEKLQGEQWLGPKLPIVNPPLWELGHLAWFQEYWCLRRAEDSRIQPSLIDSADRFYNSALVAHATRWNLDLLDPQKTRDYLERVLTSLTEKLQRDGATPWLRYVVQLAAFHEEMHNEAFTYSCQTLSYPSPEKATYEQPQCSACSGDAQISGGTFMLGASPQDGFVFDNEKWAYPVYVAPFCMARTAVTNREYAAFVDDNGYSREQWWSTQGWQWREQTGCRAPLYWAKRQNIWHARKNEHIEALAPNAAVIHVNWYEAEAYCNWAGRRLPTEAEWEFASATTPHEIIQKRKYPWGDTVPTPLRANLYGVAGESVDVTAFAEGDSGWGCRQMFGNVWEWTADWFNPYPGFVADPYKEYSEPWFATHKVLRGGCYATRASLLRNTWRNFYTPERCDVLAGFRTCAIDYL